MEPNPVRAARVPAYPTKLSVEQNPELLRDHVPEGWKAGGLVGALTLFLAANLTGCQGQKATETGAGSSNESADKPRAESGAKPGDTHAQAVRAVVAPLFEHGDGRGAAGCVVIAPPVFLSEEEALQVIREELAKSGLELTTPGLQMADVVLVPQSGDFVSDGKGSTKIVMKEDKEKARSLTTDLQDVKRRVAVEFVSAGQANELHDKMRGSSVSTYEPRLVAEKIAAQVKEKGRGVYFGTFYDPIGMLSMREVEQERRTTGDKAWKMAEKRSQEASKVLLRQQVQDFAAWLKQQGVIQ
jgi:hypothetical protein